MCYGRVNKRNSFRAYLEVENWTPHPAKWINRERCSRADFSWNERLRVFRFLTARGLNEDIGRTAQNIFVSGQRSARTQGSIAARFLLRVLLITMLSLRAWALFSVAVPVGKPSKSTSGFEKWFAWRPNSTFPSSSAEGWRWQGGRGKGVGSGGGEADDSHPV